MTLIDHLVPINNICQQKCNFCSAEYRMRGNPEIPLKKIFEDILSKGDYIQISGGEPLLHPKVFQILYFIRKYKPDCFIEFQSNGILMLQNKNLQKLLKCGVQLFNINYPCHIESVNDDICGIKGTLPMREAAMKKIIELGGNLRVNIIVNTINLPYIPEMVEYIAKKFIGLERIQLSFTKAMGAADKNDQVVPRYEDAETYFIEALRRGENLGLTIDVDHLPMCFLGEYYLHHVDYHKIEKQEEGVYQIEKNYVEKCQSCDKKNKCSGYRKDYLDVYDITTRYV